ncbi:MAG: hypothetical protein ACYDHF_01395 [Candidatus Cryosericum sp.]
MDATTRKQELAKIKVSQESVRMTGVPLRYKGGSSQENVYRIPLKYLVYNKYNGRIGTEVRSFEKEYHRLNAENSEDSLLIERFLYDSKVDRNEKTMGSLLHDQQQRHGIVTADGVIVDGNRRALLLNKLFRERGTPPGIHTGRALSVFPGHHSAGGCDQERH